MRLILIIIYNITILNYSRITIPISFNQMFKKRSFKSSNRNINLDIIDNDNIEDTDISIKPKRQSTISFKKKLKSSSPPPSTQPTHDTPYINQFDDIELETPITNHPIIPNTLSVHRLTPPFLNKDKILSSNNLSINYNYIKDKSGDLFKFSHLGSNLLKDYRNLLEFKLSNDLLPNENIPSNDNYSIKQSPNNGPINNNKNLPAYKVKDQLLKIIDENQVIIIIGETGSGKTTQLPQILYNSGYSKNGKIGITQPRRMAAISIANRVSNEMGVKLGNEVGYSIRFNDLTSQLTKIKFMTDGILLRETLLNNLLSNYSCIIIDEAHERSLNTDILLGIFKNLLSKRRDFKLIITSATMNSSKFSKFFNNAIQFKIPGKTYPVEIMYQSVPTVDYIDSAIKQALKIHISTPHTPNDNSDILIFMTGQEDIDISCQLLSIELKKLQKINDKIIDLQILPVYSTMSNSLQSKIFQNSPIRKCIIATNIAETSLTLNHIKFVIDSGLMKLKIYNPKLNIDSLQLVPISKAQAIQRSGRAGRICPGIAFRLYTLSSYENEMFDNPIPEIQRSNLMNTILLLKNLNINKISNFPFIDPPSIELIETSQYELWSIGALNNYGELTNLGKEMCKYPIDPNLSKLLIISNQENFQCCEEILKIISMLSVPSVFIISKKNIKLQEKITKIRENFQIFDSDHLTLLNIFNQFQNVKDHEREKWCLKNYFNYKSLRNAIEINSQLRQLVIKNNKKITTCYNNWEIIKECICASFFANAAEFFKHNQYKHIRTGLEMFIPITSSFNGLNDLPKFIIFNDIILTGTKQQMNYITAVKYDWLIKYGKIFYSPKLKGINSRENQKLKEEEFNKNL